MTRTSGLVSPMACEDRTCSPPNRIGMVSSMDTGSIFPLITFAFCLNLVALLSKPTLRSNCSFGRPHRLRSSSHIHQHCILKTAFYLTFVVHVFLSFIRVAFVQVISQLTLARLSVL